MVQYKKMHMEKNKTTPAISSERLSGSFIEFLRSFFRYHYKIPRVKVNLGPGEILLFNPVYSSETLLALFLDFPRGVLENTLGELFERRFTLFNWYENPYFFVIKKDNKNEVKAGNLEIWDQKIIMLQMSQNTAMSMTLSEMIIYHLYLQWQGEPTATPDGTIITQTRVFHKSLDNYVLMTIGLDEKNIETKISSFSPPELIGKNVFFKETYRLPM